MTSEVEITNEVLETKVEAILVIQSPTTWQNSVYVLGLHEGRTEEL